MQRILLISLFLVSSINATKFHYKSESEKSIRYELSVFEAIRRSPQGPRYLDCFKKDGADPQENIDGKNLLPILELGLMPIMHNYNSRKPEKCEAEIAALQLFFKSRNFKNGLSKKEARTEVSTAKAFFE